MERITLKADSTQINDFMQCPRMWYYRYHRNLTAVTRDRAALDKGSLTHHLLDYYYNLIPTMYPTMAAKEAIRQLQTSPDVNLQVSAEDRNMILNRFLQYTMYYQNDWQPLIVDGKPQVEIGFSVPIVDNDQYFFVLEGR